MRYHEPTKVYVARRIAEGKTKPETSAASNATSHAKPGHSYAHSAAQQPPKQRVDVYRSINSQGAALGTGTRMSSPARGLRLDALSLIGGQSVPRSWVVHSVARFQSRRGSSTYLLKTRTAFLTEIRASWCGLPSSEGVKLCYPVQCPDCGKTHWAGCGQHVDGVMRSVPPSERCRCRTDLVSAAHDRAGPRSDLGIPSR